LNMLLLICFMIKANWSDPTH